MARPPQFIHCPHCDHPTVIPAFMFEHGWRCRQCAGYYCPGKIASHAAATAKAKAAGLHSKTRRSREKRHAPAPAAGPFSTRTPAQRNTAPRTTAPMPEKRRKKTG